MNPPGDIGILTTDAELVVQSWDDWLATVTSIRSEDAKARPLPVVVPSLSEPPLLDRCRETLATGAVQVLSPALHGPVFPCALRGPSAHFQVMQQRVTIGPLLDGDRVAGLVISVQDVTAQLDAERELAAGLASGDPHVRVSAAEAIASAECIQSLDSFAAALRSDDWRVRRAAVSSLAAAADHDLLRAVLVTLRREHRNFSAVSSALKLLAITGVDITAQLAALLHEEEADLRIQAALALGEQQHRGAVAPLLSALEDPDINVRFHAIEALGRLHAEEATPALTAIAVTGDFFLGFAAIEALARIGDPRAVPQLVPLLEQPALRDAVLSALSDLGDERAVEPLMRALDTGGDAAAAIVQAIAAIADRLAGEALDIAPIVRSAISGTGRRHVLALGDTAPPELRPALARVLGWIGGDGVIPVLHRLARTGEARGQAVDALIRQGEAAVDALIELLDTEDPLLRQAAIAGIGQIGSRRASPHLLSLLEDPATTVAASAALAKVDGADAFEALFRHIGHEDAAVRLAITGALNAIAHPAMGRRVIALLSSPDPRERESAVRIVGYFGYPDAFGEVLALAADPVEAVRVAALEQLAVFDDEPARRVLEAALTGDTPKARAAAARALGRARLPGTAARLVSALDDEDPWVRYFSARALGEFGDQTAADRLTRVAEEDSSHPVRVAALSALAVMPGIQAPEITAAICRCAAGPNPDVARAALEALGRSGSSEGVEALRAAVRDADVGRRRAAVQGLTRVGTTDAVRDLGWIAAADDDPTILDAAVSGLGEIVSGAGPASDTALDVLLDLLADPARVERVFAATRRVPSDRLPRVAAGLQHLHPAVRRRTVDVLARLRRPEATRLLAPAFDSDDVRLREAAVLAVSRIGTRAFDQVLERLKDQDSSASVRRAAADALAAART